MKRKEPPGVLQATRFPPANGHSRFRAGFVPRKMCSYMETAGYCQKGDACTFAHSPAELANGGIELGGAGDVGGSLWEAAPAAEHGRFPVGFVPRKMCSYLESTGYCHRGDACTFAHNHTELANGDGRNNFENQHHGNLEAQSGIHDSARAMLLCWLFPDGFPKR
ncbi:unnamed protein product [Durusdinium trenchii]|uniref:C3H1-type domain-containing protein n=1 Tax=Durusdinium trenchii TaxID=1381693 RepID=A0ABP0NN94_9DINO